MEPVLLYDIIHQQSFAAYIAAATEAQRVQQSENISMIVEALKPVHLGLSNYKLPTGSRTYSLKDHTSYFADGVYSVDVDWEAVKWWKGAKTEYLVDWFVLPVAVMEDHVGMMYPEMAFRAGETFTYEIVSAVVKAEVDGWISGFVALPETNAEQTINR